MIVITAKAARKYLGTNKEYIRRLQRKFETLLKVMKKGPNNVIVYLIRGRDDNSIEFYFLLS